MIPAKLNYPIFYEYENNKVTVLTELNKDIFDDVLIDNDLVFLMSVGNNKIKTSKVEVLIIGSNKRLALAQTLNLGEFHPKKMTSAV